MQMVVHHELLKEFISRALTACGVPEADAKTASGVLIASDLRGIDSHGVARLHFYLDNIRNGRINPKPEIRVIRETASTALVDGDEGLGLVVGPHTNRMAMEKAEACGSGWVSVRNSNHYGIAGYYPMQALERDIIGLVHDQRLRPRNAHWRGREDDRHQSHRYRFSRQRGTTHRHRHGNLLGSLWKN